MMKDLEMDLRIKEELGRVWEVFFGRFGKLYPIQRQAIPLILSFYDILIISPASSGKTEACFAPASKIILKESPNDFAMIYIAPTRALINDVFERLKNPLANLNLSVRRKTQEYSLKNLVNIILTTPEGLDSLLVRMPKIFESLRIICLDEIHLYNQTPRGDALIINLNRIRLINKKKILHIGLSATVLRPMQIIEKYFPQNKVYIISQKSEKEIEYFLINFSEETKGLKKLKENLEDFSVKKFIVFCNQRQETERVASCLKQIMSYQEILIHHASLSKERREAAEKFFYKSKSCGIVATNTLELGIDIGDVDCVVFISPPPSVNILMQKLGRGCRRTNKVLSFGLYQNSLQKVVFEVLYECAKEGLLEGSFHKPRLSVACQQILSYVYQRKNINTTFNAIQRIFENYPIREDELKQIVNHLIKKGFIKTLRFGVLSAADKSEFLYKTGKLHSNIEDMSVEFEVYDITTGKKIGTVEFILPLFTLGAKVYELKAQDKNKIFVKEVGELEISTEAAKVFSGKGAVVFDFLVGRSIRRKIFGNENTVIYEVDKGKIRIYHFLGFIWGLVWTFVLISKGHKIVDVDGWVFVGENISPEDILKVTKEEMTKEILKNRKILERYLNLGSFYKFLPNQLKDKAITDAFGIDEFLNELSSLKLKRGIIESS